jgi:CCR4-NOT transcription complex subunit 1
MTQELAVTHTVVSEQLIAPGGIPQQPAQQLQISYFSIDSYSKLVTLVFKVCPMFSFKEALLYYIKQAIIDA